MASLDINLDMIIEILSHSPASVVGKCRLLNKECNKRTYDSSFLIPNLQRTNSVSGYFLEYSERLRVHSAFVKDLGNEVARGSDEISLDFLPPGRVSIKACNASHGVLLCVNDLPVKGRQPEYIVCKPTTKQFRILPKPKTRYFTIALGLMVTGTDPFRYKILRLSQLPGKENRRYNFNFTLVCEVFDSDSFAWKRLDNVELPEEDLLVTRIANPVVSYGFLHWLTTSNNVFRFCFKTNSWSFFPVPESLASDSSLKLTRYDGKVGVISSRSKEGVDYQDLWVLETSFGDSWVHVKEIKSMGLKPVGFSSNDVVTLADSDGIRSYNMNNGKSQKLPIRAPKFFSSYYWTMSYFPFYSDYERVELNGRSDGLSTRHKTWTEGLKTYVRIMWG
ncbi:F-box protein-related [Raphanus sativus]|uniref:F-box protein At5g49610-like n=1 Tax=Raphanus sativus TaxID=3726 RepID=A0A6J0L3G7_RAPSA|nr:F-box protein At5g49610-like [Raphanus sativus]KAJ4877229.1 F-box protein-related [Raphanus sativus]